MEAAALETFLDELAEFGRRHDAEETQHSKRLLNIAPETGRFLSILIKAARAARILEVGTSNGYSTIWLAWAASSLGGHVTTIERSPDKIAMAGRNLRRAQLADRVTVREGVALDALTELAGPYDLVFLDADRPNYLNYLERTVRLLRAGGLLVADNVVSHVHELREFLSALQANPALETVIIPLGNGQSVSYKKS